MGTENKGVIIRQAVMWDCPSCQAHNAVEVENVPLCREQSKALLVAQNAMTEDDELPEDFGLAATFNIIDEPETVTCHQCGETFNAIPSDPAWEQVCDLFPDEDDQPPEKTGSKSTPNPQK